MSRPKSYSPFEPVDLPDHDEARERLLALGLDPEEFPEEDLEDLLQEFDALQELDGLLDLDEEDDVAIHAWDTFREDDDATWPAG